MAKFYTGRLSDLRSEGFETYLLVYERRQGINADSETSLIREQESLDRRQGEEQETEARAFRLATRGQMSEEVFSQEICLIRTRQRKISPLSMGCVLP